MKPNIHKVLALAAIVTLALAVRLAWAHWTSPTPPGFSDAEYYNAAAMSIARGQGYSVAFDPELGFLSGGDATGFWPPGFSAVLGVAYWLFGESIIVARTVNVVSGALTVIPIYFVGRRLFGEAAGLTGALISAVLPSLVFWTPVLLSETMFTLVFASALALLLHSLNEDRALRPLPLAAAGLLIGLAALFRGQALMLLPMAVVWAAFSGMRPRPILTSLILLCGVVALVVTPWTVRNLAQMDSPIALSANFGYNLRIGHAPYSTGRYIVPQDLWDAKPGITFQEREILFNDLGRERASEYALEHPLDELVLAADKIEWLWRPDSDVLDWVTSFGQRPLSDGAREPLRLLLDVSYLTVMAAAAGGLLLLPGPHGTRMFVLIFVALWTLFHVVFFGEPRFHIPMLAIIIPAAAVLPVTVAERMKRWRATRVA